MINDSDRSINIMTYEDKATLRRLAEELARLRKLIRDETTGLYDRDRNTLLVVLTAWVDWLRLKARRGGNIGTAETFLQDPTTVFFNGLSHFVWRQLVLREMQHIMGVVLHPCFHRLWLKIYRLIEEGNGGDNEQYHHDLRG